jgi:hypothetical protein
VPSISLVDPSESAVTWLGIANDGEGGTVALARDLKQLARMLHYKL